MQKGILILLLLCVFSCTVEKRLYRPGYFVEWKHRKETVKNETVDLRLKEESNPVIGSEKAQMKQDAITDSPQLKDTLVKQEIQPTERTTSSIKHQSSKIQHPLLHQKSTTIKAELQNDPEEEREPKYANGFVQFLAVLLGIIVGIIASTFFILFIVLGGDIPMFDSNDRKPDDYKTFRSVFAAAFRITFLIVSALLITSLLVLLAWFLYMAYGIWALIGTIVGIILIMLLLGFLFNKAFDFVFHER